MKRIPLTVRGEKQLREELSHLKNTVRPEIVNAIAEARAHGDLKENAEYHAAREQQGFTEGRIKELEGALANAEVIDIQRLDPRGRVVFGATVELEDEDSGEQKTYQIVGDLEADIKQNRISISSPIARALIGKEQGDIAEVDAPGGLRCWEILSVKYV
ncbi:MAG: transcription elongation factor GreA [Lysobacteraceae bacterium]|nr:MAG: transcription elongation factor GreA [Xanthomonadaceae bacterium]